MRLAGLMPTKSSSDPSGHIELQRFCEQLVDYVSAGHFGIYNHVVTAFEQASGDKLELAKRIYPIRACTEFALEFNDKYSNADEAQLCNSTI